MTSTGIPAAALMALVSSAVTLCGVQRAGDSVSWRGHNRHLAGMLNSHSNSGVLDVSTAVRPPQHKASAATGYYMM